MLTAPGVTGFEALARARRPSMRFIATDVTAGVITDTGRWVMEEQPAQTTAAIVNFIAGAPLSSSGPGSSGDDT